MTTNDLIAIGIVCFTTMFVALVWAAVRSNQTKEK